MIHHLRACINEHWKYDSFVALHVDLSNAFNNVLHHTLFQLHYYHALQTLVLYPPPPPPILALYKIIVAIPTTKKLNNVHYITTVYTVTTL